MDKLNKVPEQSQNHEWEKKWVIAWTKNSLWKLFSALVIAWMISWTAIAQETVSSYSQIQKLTSKMKEWDKITLQVKSWSTESFIKKLGDNGFDVKKWPKWELIITKVVDLWSLEAFMDEQDKKLNKKTRSEALQAKKQLEQHKKQLEQHKKQLEQHKKYLALATYGDDLAKTLLDTLRWIQNNTLSEINIIANLKTIKKDAYAWNIISSENNRQAQLNGLETIKLFYSKNKTITNLIDQIEQKLKSYPINPNLA